MTEEQIHMMISMADVHGKGYVELEDFIDLMRQMGLINDKKEEQEAEHK